MDTTKTCQHCGKPIGPKAVGGLCPECMMKVGLGSGVQSASGGISAQPGAKPLAPAIADIAKQFPQLEILELLGAGGMGAVYKARQPQLDRLVALKILPLQAGSDAGFAERFMREARALARLSHANIVAMHEFGDAEGVHYFIMEYVDGLNLRQLEQTGRLSARQALQIIPQICEALQFAHDEGVVHRDIKPENVLLDKKGRVKIADFGLAKILGREPEALRLTGAKDLMGTPHYMAPEQVEHPRTVDHRADIYSLGVVFYEMLTGELPLGKFQPPSKKVEVDVRLDEVVLHALEKEPERRYQQASEVKTDVETIAITTADQAGGASSDATRTPDQTRSAALKYWDTIRLPIVGRHKGKQVINWPRVALELAIGLSVLYVVNWVGGPKAIPLVAALGLIVIGKRLALLGIPIERLPELPKRAFQPSFSDPKVVDLDSRSPIRAAVALGSAMFLLIFLAATCVTFFSRKTDLAHNLGIGLLLGIVNGLMTGVLAFVALSAMKAHLRPTRGAQSKAPEEAAHRQVRPPAIGLLVTGILNWIFIPLAALLLLWVVPSEWEGHPMSLSKSSVTAGCLVSLAFCGFIIYAALKMMQLERRGAAMLASVLAMLVAPGNLIGLPIGIWSLVILNRWEVRDAFSHKQKVPTEPAHSNRPISKDVKSSLLRFILLSLATVALTEIAIQSSHNWRESDQENWLIPLLTFSAVGSLWASLPFFRVPHSRWKWIIGTVTAFLFFVGLSFVSNVYKNCIVPNFVHPEMKRDIEISFGRWRATEVTTSRIEQLHAVTKPLLKTPERSDSVEKVATSTISAMKSKSTADQIIVEDLALQMLVAIRDKDDPMLQSLATDSIKKGWREALPQFALEIRERFSQMTGKTFSMWPTESLVEGDLAVVKCAGPKELNGIYLVLCFVKTDQGWRNWMMRNSPPSTPLAQHL